MHKGNQFKMLSKALILNFLFYSYTEYQWSHSSALWDHVQTQTTGQDASFNWPLVALVVNLYQIYWKTILFMIHGRYSQKIKEAEFWPQFCTLRQETSGKNARRTTCGNLQTWVQIPALPLSRCLVWSKFHKIAEFQFSHLQNLV